MCVCVCVLSGAGSVSLIRCQREEEESRGAKQPVNHVCFLSERKSVFASLHYVCINCLHRNNTLIQQKKNVGGVKWNVRTGSCLCREKFVHKLCTNSRSLLPAHYLAESGCAVFPTDSDSHNTTASMKPNTILNGHTSAKILEILTVNIAWCLLTSVEIMMMHHKVEQRKSSKACCVCVMTYNNALCFFFYVWFACGRCRGVPRHIMTNVCSRISPVILVYLFPCSSVWQL